jgi:DNA polymerase-3 subunit delta'
VSFAEVRYQAAAVRRLRAAVAADRMSHAYLFVGPRGVGKGLVARQFAKLLLCEKRRGKDADTLEPCDTCGPCRRIDRGTHPDLHWFRKEADRNDFRVSVVARRRGQESASPMVTVTESVVLHPMEGRCSVTVIDDAERMNTEAANALLKTLEEPSPHAVLILLCAEASQLPGTILSRCQLVRFGPLPEEFVAQKVREQMAGKAVEAPVRGKKPTPARAISEAEAAFICRFAGGSIEQALRLADSGLWELKRRLLAELPTVDEAAALDMAEAISLWGQAEAKRGHAAKKSAEENAARRQASRLALAAVAAAFRDAIVVASGAPASVRLTNADQRDVVEALAAWPAEACARAVTTLADGQAYIGRYVHIELATENALVQMSRLRPAAAAAR